MISPAVISQLLLGAAAENGPTGIPWIPIIIASFFAVLICQIYIRRRGRRMLHDTMQLMNEGRIEEATRIFQRAVKKDESDVISWFHLGLCRELSGDAQGAREVYESIADDPRVDFAARTRLHELTNGRLLDLPGLKALQRFEAGVGLLAEGDIDGAVEAFNEGAALHPAYEPVHYYLGACAEMKERPNEALEHYRRLTDDEREPTLTAHRIMAVEARKLWTVNDAAAAIGLRKAWNYLQTDDVARAVEELETLVRRYPDEYTAHFGLALCHILTDTPEAAREHYERVPPDDFRHGAAQEKLEELDGILNDGQ